MPPPLSTRTSTSPTKLFWITYISLTLVLPWLVTIFLVADVDMVVVGYFFSVFPTIGVLVGSSRLKLPIKLLTLALLAIAAVWVVVRLAGPPSEHVMLIQLLVVVMALMLVGCAVRMAAPRSRYQFLLGFIGAISVTAIFAITTFIGTLLPRQESPNGHDVSARRWRDDIRHNGSSSYERDGTEQKNAADDLAFTNALPAPTLKLETATLPEH